MRATFSPSSPCGQSRDTRAGHEHCGVICLRALSHLWWIKVCRRSDRLHGLTASYRCCGLDARAGDNGFCACEPFLALTTLMRRGREGGKRRDLIIGRWRMR
jgi:hypothetical protein